MDSVSTRRVIAGGDRPPRMLLLPAVTISLALYTASEFARVSNVIVWETVHDKLIRAATSLINYNLPLDMSSAGFSRRSS